MNSASEQKNYAFGKKEDIKTKSIDTLKLSIPKRELQKEHFQFTTQKQS